MALNSLQCHLLNLIFTILVLFSASFAIRSANGDMGTADTFTLSSFSYPRTTLRPFDLRYIRVDLPPWFSAVSIALNSDVDLDASSVERMSRSVLPVICFRDGSPPLPDTLNTSLKYSANSGINGLDVEQCFPMQKNITMKLTNEQISPGVWYVGLFNGIGATSTQSKMIIRGPAFSFSANISVEACINSMMRGEFCNSTVYPLSCSSPNVYNASKTTVNKSMTRSVVTCRNDFETSCLQEGVPALYSLDIVNLVEEMTIMAANVTFNITPINNTSSAKDVNLMCFARHGAIPSVTLHDYSSNLNKAPLVIRSPLIGRWYISIIPVNVTEKTGEAHNSDVRICYSVESQVLECPFGKAGPNCTMESYILQTVLRKGSTPFESYYLPIGGKVSSDSANFPIEPLLSDSSYGGEPDNIWTYFLLDIPRGAAGGNIHIRLTSDMKISYEVYARFGGLPSLDNWDYFYANKTTRSDPSMFFVLYDSSDDKVDFYIIYAREGTWGFGLRHLNASSVSLKSQTIMSLSLERCPKRCSSHGDCKFSFDASGLTSYSFCSCDRNHGGFDCSIEIISHQGHMRQSIFLIASNAAAILPAYWALRQKALAEWIIFTSSGISSALYHACDVGTWCALNYNVLQFMDFWLSFMAVISTFLYLPTIDEVFKRAIHTAVSILTALMAVTKATRSSNVVLVIVIGGVGLLIGWLIEISSKYRSLSFSIGFSLNFLHSWQTIKRWLYNLFKTLLRRFRWGFTLAGFAALAMAGINWTLETSQTYWFWHSMWHITIYTSSFFFLCSKANIVDSENQLPASGEYALTRQNSIPRGG
ncbi:Transmembrane protein 8B [Senna tora]|uniref:Transmembrane protein 8B n=1 Tax=Senna tora TaxID=362788 RepID=A0A834TY00_9FABA|nr:Transmembrane protein 8B [Senna tora]